MKKTFYERISENKRKSFFLLMIVFLVFFGLVYVIGFAFHLDIFLILILAIIISLAYVLGTYYNSDKIALLSVNAKPADPLKYKHLHNIVEGLAIATGLPKPRLYVMESEQINAFASGRSPEKAVICVTTGALKKLKDNELEGVLAHEMSHIGNYDMRFMTIVTIVVGAMAIFSQIFLRSLWFSGGRKQGNALLLIIGIVLAILAPIIVRLVQLAISRKREYLADATAVKITRYPLGLANALKKIIKDKPMKVNSALRPLFFSDPFKKKIQNIFSTHPPIEKRIEILESM